MSLIIDGNIVNTRWVSKKLFSDVVDQGRGFFRTPIKLLFPYSFAIMQGTYCTGKTGKMAKKIPCQGKHKEFGNFAKTQGICFSQVVAFLIVKSKDISKFAAKISNFFLSLISLPSQFCVC